MAEIVEYNGFTIKLVEEDGDWVAYISQPGDTEGYFPSFGITKDSALHHAKESIDKIMGAIKREAYFQGGGGVNEPTPGEKKYKSDTAITVQPRFVEPFYRNYDLYDVEGVDGPAKHGPGSGWNHMNEFKSIKDFLEYRRQRLQGKYVATDDWIEDTKANRKERVEKMKLRATFFSQIVKTAADENDGPNFDYGHGAYDAMNEGKKMKSITDFKRTSPGAFFADDNADHMLPPKEHGTKIYDWKNSPYQGKPKAPKRHDVNHIDFPIDDQIKTGPITGDSGHYEKPIKLGPAGDPELDGIMPGTENEGEFEAYPYSAQLGGFLDKYLPDADQDGKPASSLDFGHDLTNDDAPIGRPYGEDGDVIKDEDHLDKLEEKYVLRPAETEIYGLPDGVDPEAKDADQTIQTENPDFGITDSGRQMYEDKWNI